MNGVTCGGFGIVKVMMSGMFCKEMYYSIHSNGKSGDNKPLKCTYVNFSAGSPPGLGGSGMYYICIREVEQDPL